ncbi:hypothetical protein, partial [Paenibacillus timonensis]|uniref:hypothetical protein n=1 Tax=Paenibacillus timonensis TaxID=225915 RepID=UPI0022E2D5DB
MHLAADVRPALDAAERVAPDISALAEPRRPPEQRGGVGVYRRAGGRRFRAEPSPEETGGRRQRGQRRRKQQRRSG